MNALTITGNLVAKPEAFKAGETKGANFRMGNSEYVNGENRDNGFFDVTVFGPQADNVLEKLDKGTRVVVTGRINHRTYERPDGSRGGRTSLVASAVGLSLEFKDKS